MVLLKRTAYDIIKNIYILFSNQLFFTILSPYYHIIIIPAF